jgi:hypothetical protein
MSQTLPIEVVSLIHHLELHREGWWDTAVERLVLAGVWLSPREPTIDELRAYLRKRFAIELSRQRTTDALEALLSAMRFNIHIPAGTRFQKQQDGSSTPTVWPLMRQRSPSENGSLNC